MDKVPNDSGDSSDVPIMEPDTTFRHRVPIASLTSRITPTDDVFVLCHFGVPRIAPEEWTVRFDGLIQHPRRFTLQELKGNFPKTSIESFIQCAGHPLDPTINTHNASNAVWAGVRLLDVLESLDIKDSARFIWAAGADHGTYRDLTIHQDWSARNYVKDVPLSRVQMGDVLISYELNGAPLSAEHGFPARLFIPGFYGTNSVKWLNRITVSETRASGIFVNELYNDYPRMDRDDANIAREPAWAVPPNSIIVSPGDGTEISSRDAHIFGWCWGDSEITTVEITCDSGQTWKNAAVHARNQKSWQKFEYRGPLNCRGVSEIYARATDASGASQPLVAARNSCHSVKVFVI